MLIFQQDFNKSPQETVVTTPFSKRMIRRMAQDTIVGFSLNAGRSRFGNPLRFLGETVFVKVSSDDTAGSFEVIEEITPSQGGPPLHLHKGQDEWLYVLEGSFLFEINGERIEAPVGSSVLLPRGVPHTFQNIGDSPGKLLAVVSPPGVEHFFRALAQSCVEATPEPTTLQPIFERYGVELLGPPLAAR